VRGEYPRRPGAAAALVITLLRAQLQTGEDCARRTTLTGGEGCLPSVKGYGGGR
jgi:hypothetical protein